MSNISISEAQAWCQKNKLDLGTTLDDELEKQVSSQVLTRVATAYDVSGWTDTYTTPEIIKTVIAMYYAAWMYDKLYSDDNDDTNAYADKLMQMAEAILLNILGGVTEIPGVDPILDSGSPAFYPTDASSAQCATSDDPSLGPAAFSMSTRF
jgi:hypothetical protein